MHAEEISERSTRGRGFALAAKVILKRSARIYRVYMTLATFNFPTVTRYKYHFSQTLVCLDHFVAPEVRPGTIAG